jgi:hypothetical protein
MVWDIMGDRAGGRGECIVVGRIIKHSKKEEGRICPSRIKMRKEEDTISSKAACNAGTWLWKSRWAG